MTNAQRQAKHRRRLRLGLLVLPPMEISCEAVDAMIRVGVITEAEAQDPAAIASAIGRLAQERLAEPK